MQEMQVRSLGREEPPEKEWQPTPVFLTGKFHGQRSMVHYSPWGHKESDTTEMTWHTHAHGLSAHVSHERIWLRSCWGDWGVVGKIPWRRKCNPLQYSWLENSMDRRARQATVHSVAQSQTQLKRLSRMRMGPLLILVNDIGILWNGTIHSYLLRKLVLLGCESVKFPWYIQTSYRGEIWCLF